MRDRIKQSLRWALDARWSAGSSRFSANSCADQKEGGPATENLTASFIQKPLRL